MKVTMKLTLELETPRHSLNEELRLFPSVVKVKIFIQKFPQCEGCLSTLHSFLITRCQLVMRREFVMMKCSSNNQRSTLFYSDTNDSGARLFNNSRFVWYLKLVVYCISSANTICSDIAVAELLLGVRGVSNATPLVDWVVDIGRLVVEIEPVRF